MTTTEPTTEIAATLARLAALMAEQHRPDPTPQETPTTPNRVLFTVDEAAEQLSIGRTKTYALVKTGELESVQIGRLRRVPKTAIDDYAARLVRDQNADRQRAV